MIHDWRGAPVSTQQLARWRTAPQPVETGFMDDDMRTLWNRMRGTDVSPRLYGGTALALYINHRRSTDFDFATTALAVPGELDLLALGPPARTTGGAGMVTAWYTGPEHGENVKVSLVELGTPLMFRATRAPIRAPNGIRVAHPVDVLSGKLKATMDRGLARDYQDCERAGEVWPHWLDEAIAINEQHFGQGPVWAKLAGGGPVVKSAVARRVRSQWPSAGTRHSAGRER